MATEAETEMRQLEAKDGQPPPEARKDSTQSLRGGKALATPSFWTSALQNCERIDFSCL